MRKPKVDKKAFQFEPIRKKIMCNNCGKHVYIYAEDRCQCTIWQISASVATETG